MRKTLLTFLLAVQFVFAFSQIPPNYYNTASGLTGTPLRAELHNIIDNHTVKSYSFLYTIYQTSDVKPNGKVWDMYSDVPGGTPPYQYTFGQTCGNYSSEGDCYNREHSWPQSWFNSSSPMVSDAFHVYPTDGKVNGIRSNYPYGEVANPTTTTLNGSKLGPCSFPGYSGTVFEPIDEYKGDFARTYFYMCTRYYTEDSGWQTNDMIIGANLKPWALELMKKWHQQDPVSAKEIARNNVVYSYQGNRNPFIDHPEYVCLIWPGTYCSVVPSISNIIKNPSSPGVGVGVFISATINDDGPINSAILKWGTSSTSLSNTLTMSAGPNNVFSNGTAIPGQTNGTIVYFQIDATDMTGNVGTSGIQSYTVGTPPSPAPIINNITRTPSNPGPADPVTIKATITDDVSISSANVVWGTDGINFPNTILMNAGTNNLFTSASSIPASPTNTIIYYKISANDNLTQNTTSSTQQYTVTAGSSSLCAVDLIFSEYLEGSSNNKYLEIYNGTGAPVNLSDYKVNLFANGSTASTQELILSGTLNNGEVYVIKNSAATLYNGTATVSTVTFFNGDDAIALSKISTSQYVDIIGRIGEDPGTAWVAGNISMTNHTLIRKPNIIQGVSINPSTGFPTLATEWIVDSIDVATNLGSHTMNCPTANNTISTMALGSNIVCKGSVVNVSFQVNGSINTNNVYTAQLSDANGSFTNATTIGTLTSNNLSDIIPSTIPHNISVGSNYRIRVTSSDPQIVGSDNGSNISINNLPSVSAGNDVTICKGFSTVLTATGAITYSWDQGAGDTSIVTVMPNETTVYAVTGVDDFGCSNTDTVVVTVISSPTPIVTESQPLYAISDIPNGNQWYKDGALLLNENNDTLLARNYGVGIFFSIVTDNNGCVSDTSNKLYMIFEGINSSAYSTISIYPNPTNGEFTIDKAEVLKGESTLKVYSTLGTLVQTIHLNSAENKINVSDIPSGIYYITIENDSRLYRASLLKK